ncbi:MAG: terpene cyclase/mutase family protein [Planctomycetales bacterium]|nr:terpene cyclase/mutase family protein [Planctomycetales bacterium]
MSDHKYTDAPPTDTTLIDLPSAPRAGKHVPANQVPSIRHRESPFYRVLGNDGATLGHPASELPESERVRVVTGDNLPEDEYDPTEIAMKGAPPWLVSMMVHMVAMISLALLMVPGVANTTLELVASFADLRGQQLEEDVAIFALDAMPVDEPIIADVELPPVDDPLLAPPDVSLTDLGSTATSKFETANIGIALNGREPGMKKMLLLAYGGTQQTEEAVQLGLKWLARNQLDNGLWSLRGPYRDGVFGEDETAATAMAPLAFHGAGNTTKKGEYREVVEKAWRAMLGTQQRNGDFWHGTTGHYRLYAQAQATIAICEIYGMTEDSRFREPAQLAVDYAARIQDARGGGWRYDPGIETDTSVTGWFVMALQSARMAGLQVPEETWQRVSNYLDSAQHGDGAMYGYRPDETHDPVMTAEGLLCRQYLGWPHSDPRLRRGTRYLNSFPMELEDTNVYYWYYATQVYHHMGGRDWEQWNSTMRELLPAQQTKQGNEAGSWSPDSDRWGSQGGRLYTTCMALFTLEVYYRHLPIYENIYE